MVDLTVTNVTMGGAASKKASAQWASLLESALNEGVRAPENRYEQLGSRCLVGLNIVAFVKARFRQHVADVQDAEAPVGIMGVMGNKGGVSLRLRIFDSTFCFVCAHLAAHRGAVAQRNADFASIMAKTEFRDDARAEAGALAAAKGVATADAIGRVAILDHDFVIWFGDFNYRIVETLPTERCFELALGDDADLEQLRVRDQLNIERAAQRSFYGFHEAALSFRPTYKFQAGTNLYEQRPDKKLRAPAWCDRILWRCSPDIDAKFLRQLYYGSVDELLLSDHKPVHALFEVGARTVLRDRRAAVVSDITRQLDSMENRSMPKARSRARCAAPRAFARPPSPPHRGCPPPPTASASLTRPPPRRAAGQRERHGRARRGRRLRRARDAQDHHRERRRGLRHVALRAQARGEALLQGAEGGRAAAAQRPRPRPPSRECCAASSPLTRPLPPLPPLTHTSACVRARPRRRG